jgi:hypothetical protein
MPTTLDYFKTHPLRVARKQRGVPITTVRKAQKATVPSHNLHPTAGAYIHYGGVELADMLTIAAPALSQADLDKLAHHWYHSCGMVAKRLMFYTWQIITKELRHGSTAMSAKAFNGWDIDPEIEAAISLITKSGSDYMAPVDAIGHKPVGLYVDAVERHFRKGGWGGAYGGAKWADIALVFKQYIDGTSSAMLAADRAWTLVHNTGPIFNKGFYFKLHDAMLAKILDAQATTSVFDLTDNIIGKEDYKAEELNHFLHFKTLAVDAIRKTVPAYTPGSTGAVNSDGSKVKDTGMASTTGAGGKTHTAKIGPVAFHSTAERPEA